MCCLRIEHLPRPPHPLPHPLPQLLSLSGERLGEGPRMHKSPCSVEPVESPTAHNLRSALRLLPTALCLPPLRQTPRSLSAW
jgi:hypothetical protein